MLTEKLTLKETQSKLKNLPINQQILLCTDLARRILPIYENRHPKDNRPRLAIEMAEKLKFDKETSIAAWDAVRGNMYTADGDPAIFAAYTIDSVYYLAPDDNIARTINSWDNSLEFIYCPYQNAYNDGKTFPELWKTPDVLNISRVIIAGRDFASCPILADALEDAGCTDDILLHHLRNDTIGLSDWALFNLRQD
jgi:hypothetical protein